MDFSEHRLKDYSEMNKYIKEGGKEFLNFVDRTLIGLSKTEGEYDVTKVSLKHRDAFIKVVCFLIEQGYLKKQFNNTYTKIR